jgi:long-chain acyl-CoA synthetase
LALGLWGIADETPGKLALTAADGTQLTYGELAARSNQVVHGLRALGLGHGDVVATVLANEPAMIELYAAALQGGFYLTPINHHLTANEIAFILENSGARVLVSSERFGDACVEAVAGLDPKPVCFTTGSVAGFQPYAALTDGQPRERPDDRRAGNTMHYTSGTTGRPRGVRRQLADIDPDIMAELYTGFLGLFGIQTHSDNVHLTSSPLYHTAVMVFTTMSLHSGHPVVLMDAWSPELTLENIQRHRVTTSHMVPTHFTRMLNLPEERRRHYDVSSLRHIIHSAAPCPIDVKRRMLDWWGPVVYEYYAATEGGGTIATPADWLEHPGTVGNAWAGAEVRIEDDDGNPCAPGQVGEVWMSLTQADFEYHRDKDKTSSTRKNGFFTVGDIGYLTEDGFLFLSDRKADMIISGGVNIYPAEIESEMIGFPKIADVAVFGIPDADWGEQVKAVVEPADGVVPGPELETEILEFCRGRMAGYKVPKSIDFAASLPRDPNGKLYKRKLRDPYWAEAQRAI